MDEPDFASDRWATLAAHWHLLGPPMRPCAADLAPHRALLAERPATIPPDVLILGVTPEFVALPWPAGTVLRAADSSPSMIAHVWPGTPGAAILSDWCALPLPPARQHLVLLDGGFTLLPWRAGQLMLARAIARQLRPDGVALVRLFVRPAQPGTAADLLDDLRGGLISQLSLLRLRGLLALQESSTEGIDHRALWQWLARHDLGPEALGGLLGLDSALTGAFTATANDEQTRRYWFAGLDDYLALFRDAGLRVEALVRPDYSLGDCCPTVWLRHAT